MTAVQYKRRIAAVKTADAINAIEGVPVSRYAQVLSSSWARGEISGAQMKAALLASHAKLDIRDEKTLYLIEAEQSRANMMLLYEQGFHDFTPEGLRNIHRFLFGDIYQWAGEYRIINIAKREKLLAGRSVWYSNDDAVADDLVSAFQDIQRQDWAAMPREAFVSAVVRCFANIWQIHPFREGNTRTVVLLLTFFVEHYGYHMDQELLAESAGYVRDAFVMASLDQFSEYEHLERILLDAVCTDSVDYELTADAESEAQRTEKYQKYHRDHYTPEPHFRRDN